MNNRPHVATDNLKAIDLDGSSRQVRRDQASTLTSFRTQTTGKSLEDLYLNLKIGQTLKEPSGSHV